MILKLQSYFMVRPEIRSKKNGFETKMGPENFQNDENYLALILLRRNVGYKKAKMAKSDREVRRC